MQIQNPSGITNQDTLNKSINKVMSGNVSPGNGLTFDLNGQPLTFSIDNMSGCILRIAALGNPVGAPGAWTASNTDHVITHNLNKIPYGYLVIAKSKPCDVYWGSLPATNTTITLKITDDTADTTIWILA
jgi:hypothetical protein